MTLGKLMIGLFIPIIVSSIYVESAAANIVSKRHEKFMPLVAFSCGYRNQYMTPNGTWKSDEARYAVCLSGKLDILKYCQKAYPTKNITNIVEYSHEVSIDSWCREEGYPCKWTHNVRPYQCIDGEFHSEALQVPHDCQFSHVNAREKCNDYHFWKVEAGKQCTLKKSKTHKPMAVRSFAVLEPCALDMFTGVEFVCCPDEGTTEKDDIKKADENDDDKEDDGFDDDYSEESEEEEKEEDTTQDPYFKTANWTHEHDDFKEAEERMDQRHRKKVDKVMSEWAQLEARYSQMNKKDPKGAKKLKTSMNDRFQKTVAALEEEHKRMKKEIESVHEERVQAMLNEKKRDATHDYRQSLATHLAKPNKLNVLSTLKAYIRAEEKDRMHTLNRYRHILNTDSEEASSFKPTVLHRLRYIDLRINGTLAMLRDFPDLEKYVKPVAIAFWKKLREDHTPELSDVSLGSLDSFDDSAKNQKLADLYAASFEKIHASDKLDVKAPVSVNLTHAEADEKAKVLPTEDSSSEEDDDEYYEDEEDEQLKKPEKFGKQQKMKVVEIVPRKEVEKAVEHFAAPKFVETSVQTDDDDDSSSSSSESDESEDEEKNVKELRVDIEPIIDEPASFYRHEKLTQNEITRSEYIVNPSLIVFVLAIGGVCVGFFMVSAFRRRRAMRGFIEVDVYTPEERHVAGMQVNGYENPTYSFFDSKA